MRGRGRIRHWRPYPVDETCKIYLPLYKYGREQSKVWDISGNNNHGTIVGAIPSPNGIGWYFDGGDDHLILTSINLGTIHTILQWFEFAGAFSKTFGFGGATNHYTAWIDNTNFYYKAVNAATVALTKTIGEIVCLGVSRNGTSVSFYKSGVQIGTVQTLASDDNLVVSAFGSFDDGTGGGCAVHFEGLAFDRVLSAQEIRNHYELTRGIYSI